MEEKKEIKVRLSTVILLFIILILIIALAGMYYFGFVKKDKNNQNSENKNFISNELENEITNEKEIKKENKNTNVVNNEKINLEITYKEEEYKTFNGEKLVFLNKRNIPVIKSENNQKVAEKIEKSLKGVLDKQWEKIKKSSDEFKESPYGEGIEYKVVNDEIINNSIIFKTEQVGSFGGATWDNVEFYNYSIKTGEKLNLASIASDYTELKKLLVDESIELINKKGIDPIIETEGKNLETIITEYITDEESNLWGFTKNGIEIDFPKYSIGNGVDGIIKVEINKNDVNKYLLEDYKIK